MARKPTGILDQQTPAARDAIFAHCEACPLDAGVKWLASEWSITMARSSLGDWLAKERAERNFTARLVELDRANEKAGTIAGTVAGALKFTEANTMLFGQALLDAQVAKDPLAIEQAAEGLTKLLKALLKAEDQKVKVEQVGLQRRRLELLEKQSESAKQTLVDTALTPAQREQRMKEIFGLA